MSKLFYNGHFHTIEMKSASGASLGTWTAYNNIDPRFARSHYKGMTHLKNGHYTVQDRKAPHSHVASANGPYGSYGIIRFNYPGHSGVGVHSGRAHAKHKPGARHATHGCIRTTDEAMRKIKSMMADDPISSISVTGNSKASVGAAHPAAH